MSQRLTVIAFDPGETTGYAVFSLMSDHLLPQYSLTGDYVEWACGEIDCRAISSSALAQAMVKQHSGLNMAGENAGISTMLGLVDGRAEDGEHVAVVLEDFILDASKAQQFQGDRSALTPVRLISAFGFGLYWEKIDATLFVQNRTDPKRICTDERLAEWGMLAKTKRPEFQGRDHARDAVRHAFHFLRTCQNDDTASAEKRHLAWPKVFEDPQAAMPARPKKVRPQGVRLQGGKFR